MKALRSEEIFGNWGTLLLPLNADDSIDYILLAEEIDAMIAAKVNGIYSNGTAGEFYNQTDDEFDKINVLLAEKCTKANMLFQIGCSHMSPHLSLERLKRTLALKPGAAQVILPDWFPPTMEEIIDFLKKMQDVAGDIGLVLYNPPHAKKRLTPEEFHQLKKAGVSLVGCKLPGGDTDWYKKMMELNPGLSVFIPGHHLATGIKQGAHGAYSNVACLNPFAAQQWYNDMKVNMEKALELEERIQRFMQNHIVPFIQQKGYANQAVDKLMAAAGGWTNISPRLRWPYRWIGDEEIIQIRKAGTALIPEFFKQSAIIKRNY